MKVLKFGGTSVGSVKSILCLKRVVEAEAKRQPVIVVVSALGGITDRLISTAQMAVSGNEKWRGEFDEMMTRHHQMIDTIIDDTTAREKLFNTVDTLFEQLRSIYTGVFLIRDLSEKTLDAIVSYGERLSSNIVATLIRGSKWFDSREFVKTRRKNGKHVLDSELTNKLVIDTFSPLPRISLVPGFISLDQDWAWWFGLYCGHTCCCIRCRGFGNLDRCGRIYDGRPTNHQDRLHHKGVELYGGNGAL